VTRPPQADKDDEVPAPQPGPAVCQTGDVWVLGPHRIICGNALEESAYQVLMGDERAAAVFTEAKIRSALLSTVRLLRLATAGAAVPFKARTRR
jgi:hypothetical protein